MYLNAISSLQEIGNKIISVGMPILIGIAVVIAIIMVAYYGIAGKFAKNSDEHKETISRIVWVGVWFKGHHYWNKLMKHQNFKATNTTGGKNKPMKN